MPVRSVPERHWRLPTPVEALAEPFAAFPSRFLKITCDRCGKVVRSLLKTSRAETPRHLSSVAVLDE
jgi:hypothetical protein